MIKNILAVCLVLFSASSFGDEICLIKDSRYNSYVTHGQSESGFREFKSRDLVKYYLTQVYRNPEYLSIECLNKGSTNAKYAIWDLTDSEWWILKGQFMTFDNKPEAKVNLRVANIYEREHQFEVRQLTE